LSAARVNANNPSTASTAAAIADAVRSAPQLNGRGTS